MRVKPVLLGLTGALMCMAGGCGASQSGSAGEVANHLSTYEAVGHGADGALLEGTVRLISECFLVELASGERYLPYFPDDEVEWSDGGLHYDGETYIDGDAITLAGGAAESSGPLPTSCSGFVDAPRWTVAQAE